MITLSSFFRANSFKILTAGVLVVIFSLVFGPSVYANFLRSGVPISGFSYGYGLDDDTDEYGYGYGYGLVEGSGFSGYGFSGITGVATSISDSVTQTTATITYTSDYLAKHSVDYGETLTSENPGDYTGFETAGEDSITLSDLDCGTDYVYIVNSTDAGGNSWPSAEGSFTTDNCSSGGGSSGGHRRIPPVVNLAPNLVNSNPVNNIFTQTPQGNAFGYYRVLRLRMIGLDVQSLQKFLNAHGYFVNTPPGPGSIGFETWFFGPFTRAAVVRFQIANGLVPDGIVGPLTNAKIQAILNPVI